MGGGSGSANGEWRAEDIARGWTKTRLIMSRRSVICPPKALRQFRTAETLLGWPEPSPTPLCSNGAANA